MILFANNATSTLAEAATVTSVALALAPGSGAKFPSPGAGQHFVATLSDAASGTLMEIVHATARTDDTLTVVRAQEGTLAQNWAAGDRIDCRWTAGQAAAMVQA